jgi:cyclophilin family peptidyl-prolyl cis-trans isomerase/HEAT repeat protein
MRSASSPRRSRWFNLPRAAVVLSAALVVPSCMPKTPVATPPSVLAPTIQALPPQEAWEQKLAWIVRLEDQRLLREPNPPAQRVLRPATATEPALLAPPTPADLLPLLRDPQARVRRRAALAAGRVGLPEALPALIERLSDEEREVRQMAAFALGLIGDASARGALLQALDNADAMLQGRAAEALGLIGDKSDAPAVGTMVAAHIKAGALSGVDAESIAYPLAPPVEAVRLGLYALARLGTYEPLASAVLGPDGQPVSRWWPVAYALQRVGDARASEPLAALLTTPGRYTASFAIRGVAQGKYMPAVPQLRAFAEDRRVDKAVVLQAVRALTMMGDTASVPLFTRMAADATLDDALRAESLTAVVTLADAKASESLIDLLFDKRPVVRAQATRALARVVPESFAATLSGIDAEDDWTVRAAQATAFGTLPGGAGVDRLVLMLDDPEPRVLPAVLDALVTTKTPKAEALVQAKLSAPDFAVRAAAAKALADLKAVSSVPALSSAYRAAAADNTYVARAAILSAIHSLDPAAARPLLEGALADKDWALRVRAAELLKESGAGDGVADRMRPATAGADVDDPAWHTLIVPPFSPHAYIDTDKGTIEVELTVVDAPLTVRNFITLARKGFFDGLPIHRVVPDFVIQGGDPHGDGEGGPGYTIRDEINQWPYLRGTVGMALDWKDTGGSQFFITHSPAPHLDGRYTVFGNVVNGMDVVDRVVPLDRIVRVRIIDGVTD